MKFIKIDCTLHYENQEGLDRTLYLPVDSILYVEKHSEKWEITLKPSFIHELEENFKITNGKDSLEMKDIACQINLEDFLLR